MNIMKKVTAAVVSVAEVLTVWALGTGLSAAAATASISPDTIAVGENHSLVIKSDKTLWAAGDNSYGQLGVNTVEESSNIKVMNNIVYAEANDNVSFAIDANGTLYGWGDNSEGQVSASQSRYIIDSPLKLMDDVVAVSAGDTHTLALKSDGTVYGWGSNSYGELGRASGYNNNSAEVIMTNVVDIAAGDGFSLFVTKNGELYACGNNANGQLGNNTYRSVSSPTVSVSSGVSRVDAGNNHSVILKTDGTVWTAGLNDCGQLGNGSENTSNSFVSAKVSNAVEVFAGGNSSGALNRSGDVYAWGANDNGLLQNSRDTNLNSPASVASGAVSIAFGEHHSLLLKTSGAVASAGTGAYGELFSEPVASASSPSRVLKDIVSYSAGTDHAAAVDTEGRLYTWGNNDRGQLGLGDTSSRNKPTQVKFGYYAVQVWCGNKITFVLTEDDDVYAFGDNSGNMLGIDSRRSTVNKPEWVEALSGDGSVQIYPSDGYCLALMNGEVYGWGKNASSKMLYLPKTVSTPAKLDDAPSGISQLAVGSNHVLALDNGGNVWVWGANGSGQLGITSGAAVSEPEQLTIVNRKGETVADSFTYIAAAENHSMALASDGKLWVFGTNGDGQLGTDGGRIKTPVSVASKVDTIFAGKSACAVIIDDDLYLSGSNKGGALGDGSTKNRADFSKVTGKNVDYASIGDGFGGYINYDLDLMCWGNNNFGQVGSGASASGTAPKSVISNGLILSIKQPEGITLNKTEVSVKPNGTTQLTATITPSDAASTSISWSSSNTNVATVSASGSVKGVKNGTATITAKTVNGLTATCKVTVSTAVSSFTVTPSKTKTLNIGQSFTFTKKVYPANADDKTLLFESSDTDVAEVNANGKVTAISAGSAVITVTAKSNPAKVKKVTVNVRPAKVTITSRKATTNGVVLKWKDAEGADGYEVYRKLSGSSKAKSIADVDDDTEYTDDTAKKGKKYVYSIKAYTIVNGKKIYSPVSKQYSITAK
ncbi:MAG: Ig-like domain-containing protein [Oscillospiraceae bacterium]|nr:Ig-like domain-containing protein [Oscillospiraceae bacterium]